MNVFPFLNIEPPTPEERLASAKKQEALYNAALPLLLEAQRALREVSILGLGGHRLEKALEHVAIVVDQVERASQRRDV